MTTNLERIRQMTADELADKFSTIVECLYCPAKQRCDEFYDENCCTMIKQWLEQEGEE